MHIAHVICSQAFAGVERYVSTLAPVLAQKGADVSVIGGDPEAMPASLGAGVRFIPAASVRDAISSLAALPPIDIVNTHMTEADLAGIAFAGMRRTSVVSTRHFASPRGRNLGVRTAFALARCRVREQIAISRFVADSIGERSIVVHTGVAECDADPESPREKTVLVAQRLEAEKDTELAIRAWAACHVRHSGWELHIAGEGSQRGALSELVRSLGLTDSVRFLGYRSDIAALMRRSSLLVAPTPREGLGISVLEAMAMALPVLASASGGHRETVGSVDGALLFPPGDAASAAALIDGALADRDALVAYAARLQRRQRESFSIVRQASGTMSVYEGCLS